MSEYVLDASVAVAAVRPMEPSHAASRARLTRLLAGADEIVVPAIFDVEVTSALARARAPAAAARRYLEQELGARRLISIGPRAARAISAIAARTQLRAADAIYVWVACKHALPLVTLDREIAEKAGALCAVEAP